jgi:serine/threonine-protein kinase
MTEITARLSTALADRYRIERRLGEGGMATVYLAEDLKHHRKVAVKVLRPELAAVLGADRFVQEITTTANLQHPHILPLFDSGEADAFLYYVMPFIDGETLRDKLNRETQLGIDEAVNITTAIADALDYAHRHNVIHRDIKPENILLHDGRPMVADFGIALALSAAAGGRMTETGMSLGTPHYMSPEQATADKDITSRSDIYSLGSMLYEMLTGEPPHMGTSAQQIIMKIVTDSARPVTELRKSVPPNVTAAVAKSLEKLAADRFESAAKFAEALANPAFTTSFTQGTPGAGAAAGGPWNRLSMAFGGSSVVLALALGWALLRPAPKAAAVPFRTGLSDFRVTAPIGSGELISISPDGSKFVLKSYQDGVSRLFLRRADQVGFTAIPGTEGVSQATFSPDGEWLAFDVDGEIRRVELAGGPVLPVTEGARPHWGPDGTLVFSRQGDIYQVSPLGGDPTLVTDLDSLGGLPRPHLLPDGKAVIFQGPGTLETRRLMMVEIGSGVVTDLGILGNNPKYVSTGHIVYGHSSQALMAVPFDLETRRVTGEPRTVLPEILVYTGGATQFAVSETGTAVFGLAGFGAQRQIVSVDHEGSETPLPLEGAVSHPRFSPGDGRQLTYENASEIWVYDRVTGANVPLTSGNNYRSPWWSRDGRHVYYSGYTPTAGSYDGFRKLADGSQDEEVVYRRDGTDYPLAESIDGTQLLVDARSPERGRDLLLMTRGDDNATSFSDYLRADWNETTGTISPDGMWLAYVSDESGIPEVYIRTFPEAEAQQRISSGGGSQPVWAPDGSAIYYRDGIRVMRASITRGATPSVASREMLFEAQWLPDAIGRHDWDIHPDGGSFVAVKPTAEAMEVDGVPMIPVRIVVNWFEELKAQMGN